MKKCIVTLVCILSVAAANAQKMITRTGEIKFEASMPALEEIGAINTTASCILDTATGDLVSLALVKAFKFKIPLMEEHFNENYIESDTYPKATFKGKVIDFVKSKISKTKSVSFAFEGDLTLHGVTKAVKNTVLIKMIDDKIKISGVFTIKNSDFKIKIPSVVKNKVAEEVKITFAYLLEEKK